MIPKDEIESDADIHADLFVDVSRKPDTRRRKHHHKEPQLSAKEIVNEAAKKVLQLTLKSSVILHFSLIELTTYSKVAGIDFIMMVILNHM